MRSETAAAAFSNGNGQVVSLSFRGDAKHRTMVRNCAPENLEIPRCAIAHLRSGPLGPSRNDGHTQAVMRVTLRAAPFVYPRCIRPPESRHHEHRSRNENAR